MTSRFTPPIDLTHPLPDHTQLPDSDGVFVKNFQEHPQSILLTESIWPQLQQIHPDAQFCVGQDSGIYWRMTEPPERRAEAPALVLCSQRAAHAQRAVASLLRDLAGANSAFLNLGVLRRLQKHEFALATLVGCGRQFAIDWSRAGRNRRAAGGNCRTAGRTTGGSAQSAGN